jgi:hypothetical protein
MAEDGEKAEEGGGGTEEEESVKLFVGQVPKHMTEPDLLAMFRQVAAVDEVTVIKDKATRVSRGADPCARIWAGHHPPRLTRRNAGPLLPPPPAVLVLTHCWGAFFPGSRLPREESYRFGGVCISDTAFTFSFPHARGGRFASMLVRDLASNSLGLSTNLSSELLCELAVFASSMPACRCFSLDFSVLTQHFYS